MFRSTTGNKEPKCDAVSKFIESIAHILLLHLLPDLQTRGTIGEGYETANYGVAVAVAVAVGVAIGVEVGVGVTVDAGVAVGVGVGVAPTGVFMSLWI